MQLSDLSTRRSRTAAKPHTDKLAQTKQADRARQEANRAARAAEKAKKEQERLEGAAVMRRLRSINSELTGTTSKRCKKDVRQAAKKEARAASGAECEHGIWRCKICFPSTKSRK